MQEAFIFFNDFQSISPTPVLIKVLGKNPEDMLVWEFGTVIIVSCEV